MIIVDKDFYVEGIDPGHVILNKEEVQAILRFFDNLWLDRHNQEGIEVIEKLSRFVNE